MKKLNLYFLPFAGGSKYSYHNFVKNAPAEINIIPVEIPGRGSRFREQLLTNIHEIADDVFSQICDGLDVPYGIYGHSMGSLLGYLVTKRILAKGLPAPLHLFFTGASAPSVEKDTVMRYLLPKEEFRAELKQLGGSPDEILSDDNLMDFFEPILRADFEAVETYDYQPTEPFSLPVHIIIGTNEKVTYEDAIKWQEETLQKIKVQQLPGGHFFIFDFVPEIINLISENFKKEIALK